jgi:hypothetical protein
MAENEKKDANDLANKAQGLIREWLDSDRKIGEAVQHIENVYGVPREAIVGLMAAGFIRGWVSVSHHQNEAQ